MKKTEKKTLRRVVPPTRFAMEMRGNVMHAELSGDGFSGVLDVNLSSKKVTDLLELLSKVNLSTGLRADKVGKIDAEFAPPTKKTRKSGKK